MANNDLNLEYLTREENFRNVGRGKPPPCDLPEPVRRQVGLVPQTWQLEVVPEGVLVHSDQNIPSPFKKSTKMNVIRK